MQETKSNSYLMYRFGISNETPTLAILKSKFLFSTPPKTISKEEYNEYYNSILSFPIYENSFYFYFGLKDGNTAIDRLYTEYFSECNSDEVDTSKNEVTI